MQGHFRSAASLEQRWMARRLPGLCTLRKPVAVCESGPWGEMGPLFSSTHRWNAGRGLFRSV
jgi:hypothetical protein